MTALLSVNDLTKYYGAQKIFEGLSFGISERQKIGVIGRNGAGKSTLFRIITGQEAADCGKVVLSRDARLGYLEQGNDWLEAETGLAYLMRQSQQEDWRCKKLAAQFELRDDKLSQPISCLSGGWQMRLKLSAMLLKQPNLFLLDEPTNYLDLNTLILLENYLATYKGSFLIISHDREFLKKTCKQTLEISANSCYHYPGGLEEYLAFKEQRQASLIKANQGLERQQEHLREFVDRFRAKASKAKQAQAVLRKIDKLEAKRITIEHQAGITRIVLPPTIKRKNNALRVKRLTIGYSEPLVSDIDFELVFGERLVVLGLNGQGKSTLLKTLAGRLAPLAGSYHWFSGGRLAYYAQDSSELLREDEQVGAYLRRLASPEVKTEKILKLAGDFLFRDEDLKKTISVLSGGERSRLVLAGILLGKPDMLLLDEPTSHLDFETVEALGMALKKFNGAIIFTSHDRTFTNLLATGLVELRDGLAAKKYQDYDDYVAELSSRLQPSEDPAKAEEGGGKQAYLEQKELRRQLSAAEKELAKLNQRHAELMYYFSEHPTNYHLDKVKELDELNQQIALAENKWLTLAQKSYE